MVHSVVAATGGVALVAAPAFEPVSDVVVASIGGNSILVEAVTEGFVLAGKEIHKLVIEKPLEFLLKDQGVKQLETGKVNVLLITLKYRHTTMDEAALGFFRSSCHEDSASLFDTVKDYLQDDKGWFCPYLFASSRRPDIPRSTQPDIVFCHGPFLLGDYRIGETLLEKSAYHITLCDASTADPVLAQVKGSLMSQGDSKEDNSDHYLLSVSKALDRFHSRPSSPVPSTTSTGPPPPRRIILLLIGLKPHRKLWATSKRPSESMIKYLIFEGCPVIVLPAKTGAPLLAWHSSTVENLWKLNIPGVEPVEPNQAEDFDGVVDAIFQFLDICVIEWDRVVVKDLSSNFTEEKRKEVVKDAVRVLVAAAVKTRDSEEVKKELDEDRCGIAMWRIP